MSSLFWYTTDSNLFRADAFQHYRSGPDTHFRYPKKTFIEALNVHLCRDAVCPDVYTESRDLQEFETLFNSIFPDFEALEREETNPPFESSHSPSLPPTSSPVPEDAGAAHSPLSTLTESDSDIEEIAGPFPIAGPSNVSTRVVVKRERSASVAADVRRYVR